MKVDAIKVAWLDSVTDRPAEHGFVCHVAASREDVASESAVNHRGHVGRLRVEEFTRRPRSAIAPLKPFRVRCCHEIHLESLEIRTSLRDPRRWRKFLLPWIGTYARHGAL